MSEEIETIPQMREHIERLEGDLRGATSEVDRLVAENRMLNAKQTFTELGLPTAHAELFVKAVEGDITPEAVTDFVSSYGLEAGKAEGTERTEEPAEPESKPSNLAPMGRGGSGAGTGGQPPPGQEPLTTTEWIELRKRDRAAADAAMAKRGVKLRDDNPYARQLRGR